jgi:predicted TPR repeat methyltransferase
MRAVLRPLPIHISSGDLTADRRYEWARDLQVKGDLAGAADLLAQALDLAPGYAAAWFVLGEVRDKLGQRAAAIEAFTKAREADPEDRHGATVQLARLGAAPPVAMPIGYIRSLFDGYAPAFDAALTDGLDYRGPDLLLRAVRAACGGGGMKFGSLLDLGCGTGLAGAAFRPFCDWLVGVDLSPAMLAQARSKGLYDRLVEQEVMTFLAAEAALGARYHLIVAADVFVYFHELTQMPGLVARVLAPGGLIVFSVETHDGDGVILRDTLRYAHGARHVRAALDASGLKLVSLENASTRTEKGVAVPGLIVVAGN